MPKFTKINNSGEYQQQKDTLAVRDASAGKGRPDLISAFALYRLGHHYERGAEHYGDRNWERGMYCSRYMESVTRHINAFMRGDNSEDHLAAAAWNLFAIMDHQEKADLGILDRKFVDLPPNYRELATTPSPMLGKAQAMAKKKRKKKKIRMK
jgi:hypothetical protein